MQLQGCCSMREKFSAFISRCLQVLVSVPQNESTKDIFPSSVFCTDKYRGRQHTLNWCFFFLQTVLVLVLFFFLFFFCLHEKNSNCVSFKCLINHKQAPNSLHQILKKMFILSITDSAEHVKVSFYVYRCTAFTLHCLCIMFIGHN